MYSQHIVDFYSYTVHFSISLLLHFKALQLMFYLMRVHFAISTLPGDFFRANIKSRLNRLQIVSIFSSLALSLNVYNNDDD